MKKALSPLSIKKEAAGAQAGGDARTVVGSESDAHAVRDASGGERALREMTVTQTILAPAPAPGEAPTRASSWNAPAPAALNTQSSHTGIAGLEPKADAAANFGSGGDVLAHLKAESPDRVFSISGGMEGVPAAPAELPAQPAAASSAAVTLTQPEAATPTTSDTKATAETTPSIDTADALPAAAPLAPQTTSTAPTPPTIYNAVTDFSATRNQSGTWSYGYRRTDGSFALLPNSDNVYGLEPGLGTWYLPNTGGNLPAIINNGTGVTKTYDNYVVHPPNMLNLRPGPNGEKSVLRWTAPRAMTVRSEVFFAGLDTRGATSEVMVKPSPYWSMSRTVNGQVGYANKGNFVTTQTMNAGDVMDFEVSDGSSYNSTNDHTADSTGLSVIMTEAYSASGNFSATNNPSGTWSYGYRRTDGAFVLMPSNANAHGLPAGMSTWSTPNGGANLPMIVGNGTGIAQTYFTYVEQPGHTINVHPGPNGEKGVVRWTAPSAMTIKIEGDFQGFDTRGATSDVSVVKNSTSTLFSDSVSGYGFSNRKPFAIRQNVKAGDVFDFVVGNGGNNSAADSIGLSVLITQLRPAGGHWQFNEGSGETAVDATGNGNEGFLFEPSRSIDRDGSGVLNFNGTGDRVSLSSLGQLWSISNDFTISFWANPLSAHEIDAQSTTGTAGTAGQRYVLEPEWVQPGRGEAAPAISVGTNGISLYEYDGEFMPAPLVYQAPISGWTHVTVVYENRLPKLYVNGVLAKTGLVGGKNVVRLSPNLGGHSYGYFHGQLDEVRILNRPMTATEVRSLFTGVVEPVNAAPSVTLTSPSSGAVVIAPANINLSANAADDGAISKVEFFADGKLIATKTEQPYSATWGNVAAGTYSITARATDNSGVTTTSSPVSITVNPKERVNHALAANGGVATASSTYNSNYPTYSINDGDRRGLNWNAGGGWNDATPDAYPDWVEVAFSGEKDVSEVDIFTLQDSPATPSEPTEVLQFTKYGVTGFEVQYWDGAAWAVVTGGSVTGNDRVWRKLTFSPVSTSKIRVVVTGALASYSRLVEVEAWGQGSTPPPANRTNVALSSNGGVAAASSTYNSNYPAFSVNNGDRRGLNWNSGGGWNDATGGIFPDWVEVTFAGQKTIEEIDIFTLQDNPATPAEPTPTMTFTKYGVTAMRVEYWTGSAWAQVPGGDIASNNRVWNKFTFPAITTAKIRVVINNALDNHSRIIEVEAWEPTPTVPGTPPSVTLTSPSSGAVATAPVNISLAADATDDGAIRKVEFYADGKLIATKTEQPYNATWGNVAAGTYSITAKATDDSGATTTSGAVSITVNNPKPPTTPEDQTPPPPPPARVITADVVAFDQIIVYNRLGALNPAGMIYALRRDVVPVDPSKGLVPGNVRLRPDKRPRPLTLRMNVGDHLRIRFQNLLSQTPADDNQPATRAASVHATGLQLVNGILDDGSNVGRNQSSLVEPGGTATYTLSAEREGNHLMYSTAATTGGEGDGGSLSMGLFGSINVEPKGAEWYRSQLTAQELGYATTGRTPANQPIINYDAKYPAGHPRAGQYVLRMLDESLDIVHGDLNAIITGPSKGRFPAGTYLANARVPDRDQPFREFTVVYHDEIKAVQAFPKFFEDPVLSHTLHSVRDSFAINYGTGGIGAEILANRLGVGPMADCTECKYEEFFLSAWVVGDPAQVVDVPAGMQVDANGNKIPGAPRATKVFYPDDPSNVHHSYLNDHVKMRVVHAGPKEHHVHHLHAHQWLRTPDSNDSSYLDSQAMGPGYSFTTEIAYGGSGNLNKTVGDSIFHCHFYPHFAQGMWELWRVHDVFEEGTRLGADGRPAAGARSLPDAEIAAGTPIPAIVPVPTIAMPPVPTASFKGYPFYIPGVAGHRPPKPPLDTVDDGGLARHVVTGGTFVEHHTRLDFNKELLTAAASQLEEGGTASELAAMQYHGARTHPSYTPAGVAANFITNGLPRKDAAATGAARFGAQPGAPFADPCVDAQGNAVGARRVYKAANVQLDLQLNKAGWHFPQSRISVLWDDVRPTLNGQRPPEPLFFRAHSQDCITFHHTNLVPHVYAQDDFQVKTPTDIMGQHIHLVKFDVTASDGSGNGWNYEDGTFAPGEVQERVHAIRKFNGCAGDYAGDPRDGTFTCPTLKQHPTLGLAGTDADGNGVDDWLGAQTTVQRWYAESPSLRTVFTHDHFGPSTHQQAGLYGGLVIEDPGTKWKHNETGVELNTRPDGGPTSWQAAITYPTKNEGYREFLLEFSDFQLAYRKDGTPVNPPAKKEIKLNEGNWLVEPAPQCPGGVPRPCPEAVSADDVGTMSVNYRNEPVALRVRNPQTNEQAEGEAGDLSHVFRSNVQRADPAFNAQPTVYPSLTRDLKGGDPFTPMMRAYEHDRVQIQVLVGGFEEGHNFGVHGIKWLFEPDDKNSGYRNNQMMGISEHFEFIVPKLAKNSLTTDYLYQPGQATDDVWNGLWGLMRAYSQARADLFPLPNNQSGFGPAVSNPGDFNGVCPKGIVPKTFGVTAVSAGDALPGGTLVYNPRTEVGGKLHDPTAILFVRSTDLDPLTGKLKTDKPEPLILRANAGDCIEVTLTNKLPGLPPDLDGYNTLPMIVEKFNNNNVAPSGEVGLHPQLLHYNVNKSNGVNVGFNAVQTAKPGGKVTYQWYAGDLSISETGVGTATPVEFGAINLTSSDPVKHGSKGAVGALIIEPQGATWIEDANSRAQATVTKADGTQFREFVLLFQNDLNLRYGARFDTQGHPEAVPNTAEAEDSEDSGQKGFNYRTEPLWKRMGFEADTPLEETRGLDFKDVLSNDRVGGDPVTPVFTAAAGQPVRMRILMPAGHARNNVFHVHGHIWEEEPYVNDSKALGSNPLSEWKGAQYGIGPGSHFDLLLKNGAGGRFGVRGDYLFRTLTSTQFDGGLWGIFRVQDKAASQLPPQPPVETVWVEDSVPAGATFGGVDDRWNWVTDPAPFSGVAAHQSDSFAGLHQHYFYGATQTLPVAAGDKLFAYVYLDPADAPSEVMLQWNDGSWEHRAYWGANLIDWGVEGTESRRHMGPLPAAGQWVRLEVPAGAVGLEGKTLQGMAFTLFGGRASWDRAGKAASQLPPPSPAETVWSEDSFPAGSTSGAADETYAWVGASPSPYSGSLAHQSSVAAGRHQHYFYDATQTLSVGVGDKLFAYVYLDPSNMPSEVMLQWNDGSWEHRAYWGANLIDWGVEGTESRRHMGPLPAAGQWVRLEVPASLVGLEGRTLNGMAFTLYDGRATWDRTGKVP